MEFDATSGLRGPLGRARALRTTGVGRESSGISCSGPVFLMPGVPQALGYSLRPMSPDLGLLQLPLDIYEGPLQQRLSVVPIRGSWGEPEPIGRVE